MSARQQGFTLVELLVTLVIMVAVFSVAIPQYSQSMGGLQLRKCTQEIAAVLRQARNASITEAKSVVLVVDAEDHTISRGDDDPVYEWPADIDVELLAVTSSVIGPEQTIQFRPDGTAADRTLVVSTQRRQYSITVDWLTGRVRVL